MLKYSEGQFMHGEKRRWPKQCWRRVRDASGGGLQQGTCSVHFTCLETTLVERNAMREALPLLIAGAIAICLGLCGLRYYPRMAEIMDGWLEGSATFARLVKPSLIGGSYRSKFQTNQARILLAILIFAGALIAGSAILQLVWIR